MKRGRNRSTPGKAQSEPKLARELYALRRFQAVSATLTGETDLRSLLDRFLAAAIEITQADFGDVSLIDQLTGELRIVVQRGFKSEFINHFDSTLLLRTACGQALSRQERVVVRDVATDRLYDRATRRLLLDAGVRACESTPLFDATGEMVGVLSTHFRTSREPSAQVLHLLDLLCRQGADLVARVLRREQLESLVDERARELRKKNLTLSKQADMVHELSARLIQAQDNERRRIARELHDTTGQELGLIAINLGLLMKNLGKGGSQLKLISESADIARKALDDLRTLSYLLHPPVLDEFGFRSAVIWFVEGFEKRSGIRVDVDIPEDLPRLPTDAEMAFFKIVQEALTNVHRYSGSETARIELRLENDRIDLAIEDRGSGMVLAHLNEAPAAGLGVGIPGMRERMRQLGGSLEILSSEKGTRIQAVLPSYAPNEHKISPGEQPVIDALAPPASPCWQSERKRILIVDDHELVRAGIRSILQEEEDLEICGEAETGTQAVAMALELKPDLILLDLSLPEISGLKVSSILRHKGLASKILVLTVHSSSFLLAAAENSRNCDGYLQKGLASHDLVQAIHKVLEGETQFPPLQAAATR